MPETREQIIERMAQAEWGVIWPDSDPYLMGAGFLRATAASLPVAVKAVTDRVRETHQPDEFGGGGPEDSDGEACVSCGGDWPCAWIKWADQIDAELGGE